MPAATYAVRSSGQRAPGPTPAMRRIPRITPARPIGNQALLRRTPCDSCPAGTAIAGDPEQFGKDMDVVEAARGAAQKAAPPSSAAAKLGARNGERATNFENILKAHGVPLGAEMAGFFVNSSMSTADGEGGATDHCSDFPGGAPAGAAATKFCTQLPPETVDGAKTLDGKSPLSEAEKAQVAEILRVGVHEMAHAKFDKVQTDPDKAKRTIKDQTDCALDTKIGDSSVEGLLSEIVAETSEFPVFFQNIAKQKARTTALIGEERFMAFTGSESILGAIKKLRCNCPCASVETLVVNTVNEVTKGWPPDQLLAFLQAMTRILPSYWPKTLQRKE